MREKSGCIKKSKERVKIKDGNNILWRKNNC